MMIELDEKHPEIIIIITMKCFTNAFKFMLVFEDAQEAQSNG